MRRTKHNQACYRIVRKYKTDPLNTAKTVVRNRVRHSTVDQIRRGSRIALY